MKIGIYGGSFNPPHIAHLIVAESIRDQFELDQILWIPSYIPPHKTHLRLADAGHRLTMTRLATSSNPAFDVSPLEIERKGTSFTIDTITTLKADHPEHTFFLVIGEDSLREFMTWRDPEAIVALVDLLVYRRQENQQPPSPPAGQQPVPEAQLKFPSQIHFAEAPLLRISSVAIREHLKVGRSIRHLVPDAVYAYIMEHNLYQ